MVLAGLSKPLLGIFLLASGLGAGGMIFLGESPNSEKSATAKDQSKVENKVVGPIDEPKLIDQTDSSSEPKSEVAQQVEVQGVESSVPAVKKGCTLYEVKDRQKNEKKKIEENSLWKGAKSETNVRKKISDICNNAEGKDIFISKKNVKSWWMWSPVWEWSYKESEESNEWKKI